MAKSPLEPWLEKLGSLQIAKPWVLIGILILTLIPAGFLSSRLPLRTSFSELLPDDKPSVIESRRVSQRLAGNSTLTVVAEGTDVDSLKRFVDRVSPRIRQLDPSYVAGVDDGSRQVQQFFQANKHLYADLKDIQELHDDVIARYDYEVGKKAGTNLDLDEDDIPPEITPEALEKRFQKRVEDAKKTQKGVDGYYIGDDGKLAAILVRTPLGSGDEKAFDLRKKIEQIVEEEKPAIADPALKLGFTGNLITSAEQHRAVKNDLQNVGFWGVFGILVAVLAFFVRLRTLMAMGITIGVGLTWSFAAAYLSVGHLNTATGFLVSIIAGNGINFGIMLMARYLEARRDEAVPVAEAVRRAHRDTAGSTLAIAAVCCIAYGSLAVTNFHGFKHFGVIGGLGMLLCWLATYLFLPAILVISERVSPMFTVKAPAWRSKMKGYYGYPFAFLARKFPRTLAIFGVISAIVSIVLTVRYFKNDPMEYDLGNIRNERLAPTSAGLLSVRVDKIVGRLGQDGRAILTDRLDQVKPLIAELERRRDAVPGPPKAKPFDRVVSIFELLPKDQEKKIELLAEMEDRLQRSIKRGIVKPEDLSKIREHLPEKLGKIEIPDLPEQIARPFTETNGTRGTVVYIVPTEGRSVYDARYLMQWADSFREVKLPSGEIIHGTGDPVIFADMLISIRQDAPKAFLFSFVGTVILILISFRAQRGGWVTIATLMLGVLWLFAFLAIRDIKLNFLNFVALPITIGIGSDYAINIVKRRQIERSEHLYRVLQQTGGAVVLCSICTQIGYCALLLSINRAVQSFGLAAFLGEVCTLVSSALVLPAFWFWAQSRQKGDRDVVTAIPISRRLDAPPPSRPPTSRPTNERPLPDTGDSP